MTAPLTIEQLAARIDVIEQRLQGLGPLGQQLISSAPIEAIIRDAAAAARISRNTILSEVRSVHLAHIRWAIIWTAREVLRTPLTLLGRVLRRDHTTVKHGLKRAKDLRISDPAFLDLTDLLIKRARARAAR